MRALSLVRASHRHGPQNRLCSTELQHPHPQNMLRTSCSGRGQTRPETGWTFSQRKYCEQQVCVGVFATTTVCSLPVALPPSSHHWGVSWAAPSGRAGHDTYPEVWRGRASSKNTCHRDMACGMLVRPANAAARCVSRESKPGRVGGDDVERPSH